MSERRRRSRIDVGVFIGFGGEEIKFRDTIGRSIEIHSDDLVEDLFEPCSAALRWPTTHLQLAVAGFLGQIPCSGTARTSEVDLGVPRSFEI